MKHAVPVSQLAKATIRDGSNRPVPVTVMTQNDLAMCTLTAILDKDPAILRVRAEDVRRSNGASWDVHIFVIDPPGLMQPFCSLIRRLKSSYTSARYLVLGKGAATGQVAELLSLGIDGYVTYKQTPAFLLRAIHSIAAGRLWVHPDALALYIRNERNGSAHDTRSSDAITPRENEILQFVRERFTNQEIATHLGIRESTVKFHLSNLYSKLHVTSRCEIFSNFLKSDRRASE
jgi:DNA-binding NarL/FixJ family response regulator